MSNFKNRKMPLIAVLLVLSLLANLTLAQRPGKARPTGPRVYEVPKDQEDTSGRFTFARVRFDSGSWGLGRPLGDPTLFLRVAIELLAVDGDDSLAAEAGTVATRIANALPDARMRGCLEAAVPRSLFAKSTP